VPHHYLNRSIYLSFIPFSVTSLFGQLTALSLFGQLVCGPFLICIAENALTFMFHPICIHIFLHPPRAFASHSAFCLFICSSTAIVDKDLEKINKEAKPNNRPSAAEC
jgi:hypothetical protein